MLLLSTLAVAQPLCHTPELRRGRIALPEGSHAAVSMTRPEAAGYVDSTLYPIRIHYRKAEDASRAEGIVALAEDVWRVQIEEMGWIEPPADYGVGGSDAYDYYLTDEFTFGGAYTYTTYDNGVEPDAVSGDELFTNSSYIAIDDDQSWIPDSLMPGYVAHEFNHALQYATDANEYTLFAWENTAEAVAVLYTGLSSDYTIEVQDFQSHPGLSILFDSYMNAVTEYDEDTWYYEYGGWIFGSFLEQRYGTNDGSTLAELWRQLAAGSRADEPDFVDGLEVIGGSIEDLFLSFTEWRMLVAAYDDGAHYAEGSELPRSAIPGTQGTLTLSTIDGTVAVPTELPYDYGNSIWKVDVDAARTDTLTIGLDGSEDVQWGLVAVAIHDDAPATVVNTRGDAGATLSLDLPLEGATTVFVAAANLGAADLDPEDLGRFKDQDFELSFSLGGTPEDTGEEVEDDEKDAVADEEPGGCGCATVRAPYGLLGVFALFALRRRR